MYSALLAILGGCDGNRSAANGLASITITPTSALPAPCIDAGCASKFEHLHIFDAENTVFSAGGRLFVSGGQDVVEIIKDTNDMLQATVVSGELCNYTGLTLVGDHLYAACGDNRLFAGNINSLPLQPIYTITGVQLANGLAAHNGHLYVTDGPISLSSKIVQLTIDPSNADSVLSQMDWTSFGDVVSANGLQVHQGALFVTDAGQLKRFAINPDGSKGASSTVLNNSSSFFDDFTFLADGRIVMNDNTGNTTFIYDAVGNQLESNNTVLGPSSAIQGRAPMFTTADIIVTEKGTLGDNTVGNGNRLAIFTAQ